MTNLLSIGHADPVLDGRYNFDSVRDWHRRCPGGNLFRMNMVFVPINVGTVHWILGVIFMQEKRIQIFDSMGSQGRVYLEALLLYLQDVHQETMHSPLPDVENWSLVGTTHDTPRQLNGECFYHHYFFLTVDCCSFVL